MPTLSEKLVLCGYFCKYILENKKIKIMLRLGGLYIENENRIFYWRSCSSLLFPFVKEGLERKMHTFS